jgi:hypothetical protein
LSKTACHGNFSLNLRPKQYLNLNDRLLRNIGGKQVGESGSLARECHPDLHPDNVEAATIQFQAVNEAYTQLSDPGERDRFDRRWAHFEMTGGTKTEIRIVKWEGPGAKYRRERGGRKRYFSSPMGFFGKRGRR